MRTQGTSRLLTLAILTGLTVASLQAVAEPRDQAPAAQLVPLAGSTRQGDEQKGTNESPPSSERSAASSQSLIPNGRAAAICMTEAGEGNRFAREHCGPASDCDTATCAQHPEPDGEDLSASAIPREEAASAPAGAGAGSCDVLVAAALRWVE